MGAHIPPSYDAATLAIFGAAIIAAIAVVSYLTSDDIAACEKAGNSRGVCIQTIAR